MGYLDGFGVIVKKWFGVNTDSGARVTLQYPEEVRPKPERFHGRHVLNRYEDGMEKCIGCELCAAVCPAKCIYVRGQDNDPDNPTSPGERFGYVYEINYLRCIHCDLCVEACPTEAITETKLFEFSFTNRDDAIYTKNELLVGDDGRPQQLPWENWDGGFDPARDTSGWMRATAPQGDQNFKGLIAWAGELGYGVRPPERAKVLEETGPVPSVAHGHDDHDDHIAHSPDEGAGIDAIEDESVDIPTLDHAAHFDFGGVNPDAAATYEAAGDIDAAALIGEEAGEVDSFENAAHFDATSGEASPGWFSPEVSEGDDVPLDGAAHFNAPGKVGDTPDTPAADEHSLPDLEQPGSDTATDQPDLPDLETPDDASSLFDGETAPKTFDLGFLTKERSGRKKSKAEPAVEAAPEVTPESEDDTLEERGAEGPVDFAEVEAGATEAIAEMDASWGTEAPAEESADEESTDEVAPVDADDDESVTDETGDPAEHGGDDPEESGPAIRQAGHFDAPVVDEPEPKKKRRFRR